MQASHLADSVTKVLMGPSGYIDGEVDSRLYHRGWFASHRHYALVLRGVGNRSDVSRSFP